MGISGAGRDITKRKQAEVALRASRELYQRTIDNMLEGCQIIGFDWRYLYVNDAVARQGHRAKEEFLGHTIMEIYPGIEDTEMFAVLRRCMDARTPHHMENEFAYPDGNKGWFELSIQSVPEGIFILSIDITDRKRAEEVLKLNESRLEALLKLNQMTDASLGEITNFVLEEAIRLTGSKVGYLAFLNEDETVLTMHAWSKTAMEECRINNKPIVYPVKTTGLWGEAVRQRKPVITNDYNAPNPWKKGYPEGHVHIIRHVNVPIFDGDHIVIVAGVGNKPTDYDESDIRQLTLLMEGMWRIIQRKQAEEQLKRRLGHITALRNIDMAITSSLDVRVTLNIFLEQVVTQLHVDAASVLLLNPHTQTLEYGSNRGFRSSALKHTRLRLGEGHAGRAAIEQRIVSIPNLAETLDSFSRSPLLANEGFISYYAAPIIAKGNVTGVLEIFHRSSFKPDQEWLDFLEALATQAAIAIDNAELFNNLQRSNIELILAYDSTIEGWSRALDYRDRETEGHSQRVTEMTIKIAQAMGVSEAELVHVRRGALLHDIGKMKIPDNILLKPGPLTDEEWEVMRKHPAYAHELLSPIAFLRPALDIPYCHHEKWDGTGYPRGLKGEQIPLSARIFAVVDVWDALRSDRPYRPAWPEEKVKEYLRDQAGEHFDPQIVKVFLEMEW
ncbi:MAG: GAF domain-containing protein [Nitrospira sp.]|nr:GAF domain-containing protein [Nitrospira sp.]